MVGPTTSTWFALRKLRPTTASMNANRRTGKPEGWDDAVPALNPHLDHQLFEQGFPLARRPVEHGVAEGLFLERHPFERNVFGMTRFPDQQDQEIRDPIASAIEAVKAACEAHGL